VENKLGGSTLDNRVYELAREVAKLSAGLTGALSDISSVKAQIWLVVMAAVVGPLASMVVGHYWK